MKHIKTINKANLKASAEKGGCGKCQASCQSACKTSCTVANHFKARITGRSNRLEKAMEEKGQLVVPFLLSHRRSESVSWRCRLLEL